MYSVTKKQDHFLDVFHMFRRVEGKQNYCNGLCGKDIFLFQLYSPKYEISIQRTSEAMNLAKGIAVVYFYNRGENISQYSQKDRHFKMSDGS